MSEPTILNIKFNPDNDEIEIVEADKNDADSSHQYIIEKVENKDSVMLEYIVVPTEETEKNDIKADEEAVEEIVEHVCGKCFSTYSNFDRLQRHLKFCRSQTKKVTPNPETTEVNFSKIEKEAEKMEKKNICFCCGENYETCHSGPIRCYECPKSFKSSKSFERHLLLIHTGHEQFPCLACNARCPTKEILDIHMKTHSRGKPFICKKCGKEFTRKYHLYRHHKYSTCDTSQPKPELSCNACGKVFVRLDNLRSHLRQHLGKGKNRDYKCPYCEKTFYGTATLNIHIRVHTGERPFICDICKRGFPSNPALRKHRRSHTGEKPYSCSQCPKAFAAKEVLNRHMKTHTGEKPHSCTLCKKSFIQATQLKKHMIQHNKARDIFQCMHCTSEFTSMNKLTKHEMTAHCNNDDYKCKECPQSFSTSGGLNRHKSRKHKKEQTNEILCEICDKIIVGKDSYKFHLLRHNDDEQQICRICEEVFERKTLLISHLREKHKPASNYLVDNDSKVERIFEIIVQEDEEMEEGESINDTDRIEEYILLDYQTELKLVKDSFKVEDNSDDVKAIVHEEMKTEVEPDEMESTADDIESKIKKLLILLVEGSILAKFGWPSANIESVLEKIIKNCGHTPKKFEDNIDYCTKMREYVKLLFTVVIDNDSIKELLNNHSIDEVIHQVLKMAKID